MSLGKIDQTESVDLLVTCLGRYNYALLQPMLESTGIPLFHFPAQHNLQERLYPALVHYRALSKISENFRSISIVEVPEIYNLPTTPEHISDTMRGMIKGTSTQFLLFNGDKSHKYMYTPDDTKIETPNPKYYTEELRTRRPDIHTIYTETINAADHVQSAIQQAIHGELTSTTQERRHTRYLAYYLNTIDQIDSSK